MDLKNATAVCLISLFSATLVLLIARTLDLQAASRLEPQLARIVAELEAIRKQGGGAAAPGGVFPGEPVADGLVVYYFHGNVRCPTCRAIESQSYETVHSEFASPLARGEVVWKIVNYEQPEGAELAEKFEVHLAVVVLARKKAGQIEQWKRLDQVWALVGDKRAFQQFLGDEIRQMLPRADTRSPLDTTARPADRPAPAADVSDIPFRPGLRFPG
jgi:hypothetical protein